MPWGYTGYPRSTSSSVFHGQQEQPRLGLLDRLAGRMSDFGYGSGEEDKRAALRRALAAMGARMASGALSEGTGALAPAIAQGFAGYQQGLSDLNQQHRQEASDRLQEEQLERQNRISDAQIENYEADNQRAADEAAARLQARKDLIAGRRAALEKLTPEQRARLEGINIGDEKFDDRLWEATKPPETKDPKPPHVENFTDGTSRQWDPARGEWIVMSRKPAERGAEPKPPEPPPVREFADDTSREWDAGSRSWRVVASKPVTDDVRKQAEKLYTEAINEQSSALLVRKEDGTPDLRGTWAKALEAAMVTAPSGGGARVSIPGDPEPNRPLEMRVQDVAAAFGGKLPPAVLDQVRRDLRTKLPREVVAQIRAAMGRR